MKKFLRNLISVLAFLSICNLGIAGDGDVGQAGKRVNAGAKPMVITDVEGDTANIDDNGRMQVVVEGLSATLTASNVEVTDLVPGVTGTALGKAEDAAHTSADTGVGVLAVRNDTIAALAGTDGDYAPLQVNSAGYLAVASLTEVAEDAAHVSGTTGITPLAVRNDALAALGGADGDNSPVQVGAEGAMFIMGDQPEDTSATAGDYVLPAGVVRNDVLAALTGTDGDYTTAQVNDIGAVFTTGEHVEDGVHVSGDYGNLPLAVRNDTIAALGGTDGDYAPLQVNATGYLATADAASFAEDAAHTTADKGLQVLAVRNDVLASQAGTDADYTPIQVNDIGAVFVTGEQVEDAGHTTADYLLPIATQRLDAAASSAGTTADYATMNTNGLGKVYVSQTHASPSVLCTTGDAITTGIDILPSAGGALKNRIYKITVLTLAAEVITVTELSGFTTINTAAGIPVVFDFGEEGLVQTTAATAINFTSADASSVQIVTIYSAE